MKGEGRGYKDKGQVKGEMERGEDVGLSDSGRGFWLHVINSGDLLNKIKDINIQNKTINSFDITSLYANIPIKNSLYFRLTILP